MKEATGDLNMTLVVVILVAVMVAFFSMVIWPSIKGGVKNEGNCSDAICLKSNCDMTTGVCKCDYYLTDPRTKRKTSEKKIIYCPYRG